jgi:hypothetical protein
MVEMESRWYRSWYDFYMLEFHTLKIYDSTVTKSIFRKPAEVLRTI